MTDNPFDPGQIMAEIKLSTETLDAAADTYYDAVKGFEETEAEYEYAMAKERVRIYEEAKRRGDKPPAEDLRNSLALHAIDEELRVDYAAKRAQKEAYAVKFRALLAAVNARQSLLRALTGGG